MKRVFLIAFLGAVTFTCVGAAGAPPAGIRVDGRFGDWEKVVPSWTDPSGDGSPSGIDIRRVWLACRENTLFLRFELGEELSLQSNNALALHLDTDNSPDTGLPVDGIGADLSWHFGDRVGFVHTDGNKIMLSAYDVGLVTAPTVTSRQFEVELRRDADVPGVSALFPSRSLRWVLRDEGSARGDVAPDAGTSLSFSGKEEPAIPYPGTSLEKARPEHLRIVTYNVFNDGLFHRKKPFHRILSAVKPDVINFQEISSYSASKTKALIARMLGGTWYAAGCGDTITVSRYPIKLKRSVAGNLGVMIDLPDDTYATDIFIINAHLASGLHDRRRQRQVDEIASFIRRSKRPDGAMVLPPGTPILLLGDLNLVGFARQLETLLTGDVAEDGIFGPDEPPDWDSSHMTDVLAYHTCAPEVYTWWRRRDPRGFGPGRLDYIIYTDSVISPSKSFVVCTETMSPSRLSGNGLLRHDSSIASDHLPVVVDFILPSSVPHAEESE